MFNLPPYFFYRLWHLTILESLRDWKWSLVRDWKSLKYSIRHLRLHTICPECVGAGEYYNSYDMRDCSTCKDKSGFVPVRMYHVKQFLGEQKLYELRLLLSKGCTRTQPWAAGECLKGTLGCKRHR